MDRKTAGGSETFERVIRKVIKRFAGHRWLTGRRRNVLDNRLLQIPPALAPDQARMASMSEALLDRGAVCFVRKLNECGT